MPHLSGIFAMTKEDMPSNGTEPEAALQLNLYGPLTDEQLEERFRPVLDQVSEAANLVNGCVTHTFNFGPVSVKLRTLSRRTQRGLASPLLLTLKDQPTFSEVLLHRTYALACSLEEFNGKPLSIPRLDPDDVETWLASESVKQFVCFIEDMDSALVERLIDAQADLELLRTYFLTRSLKNQ